MMRKRADLGHPQVPIDLQDLVTVGYIDQLAVDALIVDLPARVKRLSRPRHERAAA